MLTETRHSISCVYRTGEIAPLNNCSSFLCTPCSVVSCSRLATKGASPWGRQALWHPLSAVTLPSPSHCSVPPSSGEVSVVWRPQEGHKIWISALCTHVAIHLCLQALYIRSCTCECTHCVFLHTYVYVCPSSAHAHVYVCVCKYLAKLQTHHTHFMTLGCWRQWCNSVHVKGEEGTFVSFCSACSAFSLYRAMSFFCCWMVLCKLAMVLRNSLPWCAGQKQMHWLSYVIHKELLLQIKQEMWKI